MSGDTGKFLQHGKTKPRDRVIVRDYVVIRGVHTYFLVINPILAHISSSIALPLLPKWGTGTASLLEMYTNMG